MKNEAIREMRCIYDFLEDEESKRVYLAKLNYLVTGDYRYIDDIVKRYYPFVECAPKVDSKELRKVISDRPVYIWGAGGDTHFYQMYWKEACKDQLLGIIDKNKKKQKNGFLGYSVVSPEAIIEQVKRKDAFVLLSSSSYDEEIKEEILCMGIRENRIISGLFPRMENINGMYFDPDIIHFEDAEIFVDGGSYNLDTALELREKVNVKKIYSFEADPGNYQKCLEKKEESCFDEAEIFPYGLWSCKDKLRFDATGGADASLFGQDGESEIEVRSLEEVIGTDEHVSFIKMDIEGAEMEALKGCTQLIRKNHPKLAICIYHKPEDMYELPRFIKNLVPEYRFYLRHYSNREVETVLYAVTYEHGRK